MNAESFQKEVWNFYKKHGRHDLPWRKNITPYTILVSEIMLQQTQVSRGLVKYPEFISRFPDFKALASAPLPEVLEMWSGLGYNRRAIFLKKCAEAVQNEYTGTLPETEEKLKTLPGIGPATAASILAFAFNKPTLFIETNIRTVFIHYFFPNAPEVSDKELLPLVEKTLDHKKPREWYYALMDLGSAIKKQHGNANTRSKHYTKQKPFKGSERQLRGKILRYLLTKKNATLNELKKELNDKRVESVLDNLEKEGFIQKGKGTYALRNQTVTKGSGQ